MASERTALIEQLKLISLYLSEKKMIGTKSIVLVLIRDLGEPYTPKQVIIQDFILTTDSFILELGSYYADHFVCINELIMELSSIAERGYFEGQSLRWDPPEERGSPETLGKENIYDLTHETNPVTKTLLHGLDFIGNYETGKANFANFVNGIFRHYPKANPYELNFLVEKVLTLEPKHIEDEASTLGKKNARCEVCRIRNGFSHFRYKVFPDGTLHIWDIKHNEDKSKTIRIFDRTYTPSDLVNMRNKFYERIEFLNCMAYLYTFRWAFLDPDMDKYLH